MGPGRLRNEPTNPVKGPQDASGVAALAWDSEYLYIAGHMTDDHLLGVKRGKPLNVGPPGWGCDSLMVRLISFRQKLKTNSPYSREPFLALRYMPPEGGRGQLLDNARGVLDKADAYWKLPPGSEWECTEHPDGYDVEARVPWKALNFDPRPGALLFCGFLMGDVDPDEALNQVGWCHDQPMNALFRLAETPYAVGSVLTSLDRIVVGETWKARAELDAVGGPASMMSLVLKTADGRQVSSRKLQIRVSKGMTGSAMVEFVGEPDKPGTYRLELVASLPMRSAPTVLSYVPVEVVERAEEAPPVVSAPGEIHHMPPDRVAFPAPTEERLGFYRHGFVKSREDYVPFILKHVKPGVDGAMRQQIESGSVNVYKYIPWALALYRITGEQQYATLVRDAIDETLDQLQELKNERPLRMMATVRYLTWLKDPDTELAPQDAEQRYLNAYHYLAANPGKWRFSEWGTHNRCWHRYIPMRIAMEEAQAAGKPVDERIPPYVKWHTDRVWKMGDDDDNSAGYHWVFFRYPWQYFMHKGDWNAFLEHPHFLNTIRRYVEMVAPDGAVPQFGSTSGWPTVGASMYVYEWMSTITGDGRFKWASHRIAEYYYNHLDHRLNQYHVPADGARDNFVLAYLLADDSVAPKAPPPGSRITWRRKMEKVPPQARRPGLGRYWMVDKKVPDKAVLASGNGPNDLWGLVELVGVGGHCGELPGAIHALIQYDSALLVGQGYYENVPEFQNIVQVEDLEGVERVAEDPAVSIPAFVDDGAVTYLRISTEHYQRLPVTYVRDIVMVKNQFLLVKDRVRFNRTMKTRVGPCWQARSLGPTCGEHWFNCYYQWLYHTGLGLGRGVQSIRNPNYDLLVWFSPRAGRRHVVLDRTRENVWRCSPIKLRQEWAGMPEATHEVTFTTILLPHAPTQTPETYAAKVKMLRDDDESTAVRVADPRPRSTQEAIVVLNEPGRSVALDAISTDARMALVLLDGEGNPTRRVVCGGTRLSVNGTDQMPKALTYAVEPFFTAGQEDGQ